MIVGKLYTVVKNHFSVFDWRGVDSLEEEELAEGKMGSESRLDSGELVVLLEYIELVDGYRAKFLRKDGTIKYLRMTNRYTHTITGLDCFLKETQP